MFHTVLISLLLLDAIILMVAVLLQSGKGGGLAASFGGASAGDQVFGARQAGNLLTKVTWWSAGIFIGLAFFMQIISTRAVGPTSVLDQSFAPAKSAPPPTAPSTQAPTVPLQKLPPTPPPPAGGAKTPPDPAKKQP